MTPSEERLLKFWRTTAIILFVGGTAQWLAHMYTVWCK